VGGRLRPAQEQEEQEQAALALRLVDERTSATEVRETLEARKIDYLFIYKPTGGAMQTLVNKVPVYLSYENDAFIVLRVRRAEFATAP
jgi:hypothetical protein